MNSLSLIAENLTNGYNSGLLNILSLTSIFFGISVIVSKNPIVSVLFLISLFCTVASYIITLGMHFIGLSYLLVYVGAISILFLFILMLINVRISELVTDTKNSIPLAVLAGSVFTLSMYLVLPFNLHALDIFNTSWIYTSADKFLTGDLYSPIFNYGLPLDIVVNNTGFVSDIAWDGSISETSDIVSIGNIMYSGVFMWLIVISLILLLAMVGAIVITIKTPNKS